MKKINGIGLELLTLHCSRFHGYSITFMNLSWLRRGKVCNIGNGKSLLHIGVHHGDNSSLIFSFVLFGFRIIRFYLKPRIVFKCKICGEMARPESDFDDTPYWCDTDGYLKESEIEIQLIKHD